ncbi:FtsX-like permease family protein [candidate division KSB1 bacterium]|nr:FtsX-like permease family protein [candidate division KSB1 bacterium]NIR69516.1 FtsX-like permease family protein [candidate division KSB1 bacterium]NIS24284.1 FtsX-like permease family protein [candidate division KSB1 bacterium]NIT71199.1 FtsX-like permease family protein [candidate division KSB1 bacterium]NIU24903.1 FtsX-like permease family protein [candidate division KSB1 bacterium]
MKLANFQQILVEALVAIRANKLRSVLTTLGIVIGVLTVIAMQTFIEGLNKNVDRELSVIGGNTFYVQKYPAMTLDPSEYRNRKNITMDEAEAIEERAMLVSLVAPEDFKLGSVIRYGRKKTNPDIFLLGGTEAWHLTNGFFVQEGRFLSTVDLRYRRQVVVLGLDIVEKLFPFQKAVDKEVLIDGRRFTAIGVFEEKGNFFGQNRDNLALIPITTFEKIYGEKRSIGIAVKASEPELLQEAMDEVTGIMRVERGIPPGESNDFEVLTKDSLMETWNNLTNIVFSVAIGICLISLLVGGIGVMNIMLVSVTERTREIGIRKSVGAKQRDILMQFLVEAIIICEIGGFIGVLLGLGLAKVISGFTSLPAAVPIWSIFLGLGFVSVVGIFFGIYPAAKAARLHPIGALRYE